MRMCQPKQKSQQKMKIKVTRKTSLLGAFKSAAAALFGVQNSDSHKSDFESETPFPFILAGVILVIGFIIILVTVVDLVLS